MLLFWLDRLMFVLFIFFLPFYLVWLFSCLLFFYFSFFITSCGEAAMTLSMPLSCGSFVPMGPLPMVLRALSLAFWFLFLFYYLFGPLWDFHRHRCLATVGPAAASRHWTLHQWCHGQCATLRGGFRVSRAIFCARQLGFCNPIA